MHPSLSSFFEFMFDRFRIPFFIFWKHSCIIWCCIIIVFTFHFSIFSVKVRSFLFYYYALLSFLTLFLFFYIFFVTSHFFFLFSLFIFARESIGVKVALSLCISLLVESKASTVTIENQICINNKKRRILLSTKDSPPESPSSLTISLIPWREIIVLPYSMLSKLYWVR